MKALRPESAAGPICPGPGCTNERGHRALCDGHRKQRQRGQALRVLRGPHGLIGGPCVECGRERKGTRRGTICPSCRGRFARRRERLVAGFGGRR